VSTATIRDVAKRAGVGIGTVSRVLNNSPSVSDATRTKVLSAIEALDYTPNPIARRLSLGKTLTIAVIAPFFTRPSVVERLRGIEQVLADSEYDLIVFNVETSKRRDIYFQDVPRRERVDGLLVISLMPLEEHVQRLLQSETPTVLVDVSHPRFSQVVIDDVVGGRQATEHLLSLGHRKIGFLSDYNDSTFFFTANRDRFSGYRDALEEAGIDVRPQYSVHGEHSRESAYEMSYRLLTLPDPPTAIFATSDTLATGALEAAHDMELDVPEELSVIGYDDIEMAEYLNLTTIRQRLFESGVRGGELLLEALDSPPPEPRQVVLPTDLVVRATTAPPASA
jgi:DNA-binding LacI/PurR family transcriptional regulator